MANLTISVDEEVLKRARIRALEENTSVNAVLGQHLEEYAAIDQVRRRRQEALKRLLKLAEAHGIHRGGERWSREALYER
jgi:hypothetical protein